MAFPNVSDIIATTIEARSKRIRDNVTKNNAVLERLSKRGKVRPVSGGRLIYEEISFAENGNAGWYSGADTLPTAQADVISAAQYDWKQAAVPVVVTGLELGQNAGEEQVIDLVASRLDVAESSMANLITEGIYSDGTGYGGKQVTGLEAALAPVPTSGTYGGIDRSSYSFWRNQVVDSGAAPDKATIQGYMNTLWSYCVRGVDRPDLIMAGSTAWAAYMASLQSLQRFTDPSQAGIGFPSIKFMDADVVLDGGIGGFATAADMYFLNTKYIHFRPHRDRNMVPLAPDKRYAVNQDAEVQILAFMGNLTCSGARFQGRLVLS